MDLTPHPKDGIQESTRVKKREPLHTRTGRQEVRVQRVESVQERALQALKRDNNNHYDTTRDHYTTTRNHSLPFTLGVSSTIRQTLFSRATGKVVSLAAETDSHSFHLSLAGWFLRREGSWSTSGGDAWRRGDLGRDLKMCPY